MPENQFLEGEFPFGTLSRFGITEEMLLDLPQSALKRLGMGQHSPVLPIKYKCENGCQVHTRARIRFVREEDGSVDAVFIPQLCKADLSRFNDAEKKLLEKGEPVFGSMPSSSGENEDVVFQLDALTRQVTFVLKAVIAGNLALLKEKYGLNPTEHGSLLNGHSLTIYPGNQPKTMGIDLQDDRGVRIEDGEEEEWRAGNRREWSKYEFGINGCWVTDDEGNLDYVREEDYTDELWNEQKKAAQRNAQSHSRR